MFCARSSRTRAVHRFSFNFFRITRKDGSFLGDKSNIVLTYPGPRRMETRNKSLGNGRDPKGSREKILLLARGARVRADFTIFRFNIVIRDRALAQCERSATRAFSSIHLKRYAIISRELIIKSLFNFVLSLLRYDRYNRYIIYLAKFLELFFSHRVISNIVYSFSFSFFINCTSG